MELLKDLAIKKTLSILRDVTGKIWILIGSTLFTIFLLIEIGKSASDIYCDAEFNDKDENLINKKCYLEYQNKYSKLPVYGFVFINFFTLAIVPIIFSILLKLRVNKLETTNQNLERQLQQNKSKVLFYTYCGQLASTILLATGFIIVLHTSVFRASTHFPSNFKCILLNQGSNSSAFSSTYGSLTKTDIYTCHNTRATEKFGGSVALTVFNGIWAIFALIELVRIFSRARNGLQFMCDPQFYADHLRSNREQEQRQQQSEEAGLLSGLRSEQQAELELVIHDRRAKYDFPKDRREQEQSKKAVPLSSQDSEEDSASSLPEQHPAFEPEQQTELQAELTRLEDCIKERTEQLKDLNQPIRPRQGEGPKPNDLKLDQIFVKLAIRNGVASYDFLENRLEQLKVFSEPQSNQSEYVPWQDIIDGNNKHILLVGRPGIGKTILSTKLLRGSAFNEFTHQNFDVAFLVKFRHYNSRSEDLNLRELLSCSETVSQDLNDKVWNYIITNPTKVLLIFDGIDEFNARSAISKDDLGFKDSVGKKMPLHCLYEKIASGEVLKGATVITTSRSTASSCLQQLRFDTVLEILGFTPREIEEYVERFTKEGKNPEAEKKAMWEHIRTNINLFTLCYVPVNCFIICSCLSWFHSCLGKLPTKLTDIYSTALKIFYFRHNDKFRKAKKAYDDLFLKPFHKLPSECKEEFKRLGKIAFLGIKEGRLLFTSKEVEGLENCGFLHRLRDLSSTKGFEEGKPQYCFIHLTFQEFLAAKHVVDTMTAAYGLPKFITNHIDKGPWQLVVQFVAGLLADSDKAKVKFSKRLMKLLPTSNFKRWEGEGSIKEIIWPGTKNDSELAATICKCLYELDAKEHFSIPREVENMCVILEDRSLAPADCTAILHFLKNHVKTFKLWVNYESMSNLICMEIKKWIVESDFSGGDCKLEELVIVRHSLGDEEAKLLSDAIKDEKCKLTRLNLKGNCITKEGAKHLSAAIQNVNNNLTVLDMSYNKIRDKGVKLLSGAIKHRYCKLTKLLLASNDIKEEGAEHLRDALKDVNNNLTVLDMSYNKIRDKGVKLLSGAIKHRYCKLTKLLLASNDIKEEGAEHLRDALKDVNNNLTLLDLSFNSVKEKGAKYLSEALKDVHCKLTVLNLTCNYVGDEGAECLSNALRDVNCNLSKLFLKDNHIGEKGAKHLRDECKDALCKIII